MLSFCVVSGGAISNQRSSTRAIFLNTYLLLKMDTNWFQYFQVAVFTKNLFKKFGEFLHFRIMLANQIKLKFRFLVTCCQKCSLIAWSHAPHNENVIFLPSEIFLIERNMHFTWITLWMHWLSLLDYALSNLQHFKIQSPIWKISTILCLMFF